MKKIWKRIAITVLVLAAVGVVVGLVLFKLAERKVAGQLHPPELVTGSFPAIDFPIRTLDGKVRRISEFKGKVVFLDLWGTWCIQCVAEMPTVQRLYSRYMKDPAVEFLIVSRMDSPETVRHYAHRNGLELPFYVTHDEDVPQSMYLKQYPATFIYSKDGQIVAQHAGGADWSDESVIHFIDQLRNAK